MRRGNRRGDGRHGSVWAPAVVALAALALCGTAVATSAQSPDATSGAGSGTPDATLAYCGPPPCRMPLPFAEYEALLTEKGSPLCRNIVPESCQPSKPRFLKGNW